MKLKIKLFSTYVVAYQKFMICCVTIPHSLIFDMTIFFIIDFTFRENNNQFLSENSRSI